LYCSNVFVITVLGKGAAKKDPLDFILVASDDSYYQETVTVGVTFFFLSILSIIYPSRLKAYQHDTKGDEKNLIFDEFFHGKGYPPRHCLWRDKTTLDLAIL
jgi:hypothetical protein